MPESVVPSIASGSHSVGEKVAERRSEAPSIWQQVIGVFTAPKSLFQRLGSRPRWGQAQWVVLFVAWCMISIWAVRVDVDALQRPILERNAQVSASDVEQTIAVSTRFILPMAIFGGSVRSVLSNFSLALVFWLFGLSTREAKKPSFLHALSGVTVANLVLVPYTLMMGVVCWVNGVGSLIPERLAPSGLAYYLQPENPRLYGLLAQVDVFILAYFAMLYLGVRYTMRLQRGDALACTALGVVMFLAWKVYFWV